MLYLLLWIAAGLSLYAVASNHIFTLNEAISMRLWICLFCVAVCPAIGFIAFIIGHKERIPHAPPSDGI